MTTTTIFILVYLGSMLICLGFGYFFNWDELHTVGDFLTPLFMDSHWGSAFCIYVPFINMMTAAALIVCVSVYFIYDLFRRLVMEWTGIGRFVSKIFNYKVK